MELGVALPSFAMRDLTDQPLQLLDALVDLWLFSQSCSDVSDVIGLGCCGEGDGLGCASGRRFPSDWRWPAGSYFSGAVHCRLVSGLGSGQGSSAEAAVGGRRHARLDFGDRHVSQSSHFTAFGRTIHIARSAFR